MRVSLNSPLCTGHWRGQSQNGNRAPTHPPARDTEERHVRAHLSTPRPPRRGRNRHNSPEDRGALPGPQGRLHFRAVATRLASNRQSHRQSVPSARAERRLAGPPREECVLIADTAQKQALDPPRALTSAQKGRATTRVPPEQCAYSLGTQRNSTLCKNARVTLKQGLQGAWPLLSQVGRAGDKKPDGLWASTACSPDRGGGGGDTRPTWTLAHRDPEEGRTACVREA
ncbi:uncharacterized protein LOC131505623 [Neofelis nebulosa]|uniref:uncharacterized protein LOC131505623 n=1 Tax=Neofelis nebulosa TaxID=61452 RepID=UPI002729ECF3|nr:uncharacterized protein LOC131505623 [Neofelis nebulosa]